jgi:hypothetical protein
MELCHFYAMWPCFLLFQPRYPADQWLLMRRLKKLSLFLFIGVLIFLVSSNKSNDLLIHIVSSSYHGNKSYRNTSDKIETGMVLIVLIACPCLLSSQL